jgi:hypothetical protein
MTDLFKMGEFWENFSKAVHFHFCKDIYKKSFKKFGLSKKHQMTADMSIEICQLVRL